MTRVRRILCREITDDIHGVQLVDADLPEPGPGEIQLAVKACAVNFPDILMIQGKYQHKPPMPFTPGGEVAGDVVALGPGVSDFAIGDRVFCGIGWGGFTEALNVPVDRVRHVPGTMTYAKAASYQAAYMTARVALHRRGQLKRGETLLVHGATGGVGLAAVDLGKQMGAYVIATGGRDDKLAIVKARGADHVINYSLPDGGQGGFREAVKDLTDGRGADVIYDPVGGAVFEESMRCVNWDGRILTIGFTSGEWPKAAVNHILIKHISVIGVRAGEYSRRNPEHGMEDRNTLYALAAAGAIDPYVCASFPLDAATEAMQMLIDREVVGKVVVTMNGYDMEPGGQRAALSGPVPSSKA